MKSLFALLVVSIAGLCGCRYGDRFDASKIVDHSTINSVLQRVAAAEKLTLHAGGGGGGGGIFRASVDIDTEIQLNDAVRKRFMKSLRDATQALLADQHAIIHGWGKEGDDQDMRGFSWEYSWKENNGIMRARFYPASPDHGRLEVFCYEHRRGAKAPPPAKGF